MKPIRAFAVALAFATLLIVVALLTTHTVAQAQPASGYVRCATEGQVCNFSGPALVVYGADKRWTLPRQFAGGTPCSNAVFTDPAYLSIKSCWYLALTPTAPPPPTAGILFNVPPPGALFRVPPGWSDMSFTTSALSEVPLICARAGTLARPHVATVTGTHPSGPFTYTICETDGGGIVGWWRINPRSAVPLADK